MNNRTVDKSGSQEGATEGMEAPNPLDSNPLDSNPLDSNPLDSWLRRELTSLYGRSGGDDLPPELAELASRLEEKLKSAHDERPHEAGRDRDRAIRPAVHKR